MHAGSKQKTRIAKYSSFQTHSAIPIKSIFSWFSYEKPTQNVCLQHTFSFHIHMKILNENSKHLMYAAQYKPLKELQRRWLVLKHRQNDTNIVFCCKRFSIHFYINRFYSPVSSCCWTCSLSWHTVEEMSNISQGCPSKSPTIKKSSLWGNLPLWTMTFRPLLQCLRK